MDTGPGCYQGRHYTAYVDQVKDLKRKGDYARAERLLLELVNAVEAEAKANDWAVAPAYYEQLAIIYRKQKDSAKEIAILERYLEQLRALWNLSPVSNLSGPLEDRLRKAQAHMRKGHG